ncbi:alpha/beta hydrolase, partial [Pseudonocardia benzenivorans]
MAVVLPGSGSDAEFVRSSFAEPLSALGIRLVAPWPRASGAVVAGYLSALDDALRAATAARTALLVGGVSLGAHVAIRWAAALDDPRPLAGVLLALPAWTGSAGAAPAAVTAAATAARVRAA